MARDDFESSDSDDDDDDDRPARRGNSRTSEPSGFVDFLVFRRMLVPYLVQLIFWLGVIGILWYGIQEIAEATKPKEMSRWFFLTLLTLLVWRVMCENFILLFKMNDRLNDIHLELRRQSRKR